MPCYDTRSTPRAMTGEISRLKTDLDEVTDLLCKVGKALHNNTDLPEEVLDWIVRHKEADALRGEPWEKV